MSSFQWLWKLLNRTLEKKIMKFSVSVALNWGWPSMTIIGDQWLAINDAHLPSMVDLPEHILHNWACSNR